MSSINTTYMGGVDHGDQLRGYYHVRLKNRKYYKYIFLFLFDVSITNSYVLFKEAHPQCSLGKHVINYRIELAHDTGKVETDCFYIYVTQFGKTTLVAAHDQMLTFQHLLFSHFT